MTAAPNSPQAVREMLAKQHYVCGRGLSVSAYLALALNRPLLIEGAPGVGKTEIAKALAAGLGRRLIRLQCFEGVDVSSAAYEWNFAAQMIEIRLADLKGEAPAAVDLFSERFLLSRPLLEALKPQPDGPPVLLIDEIDRADPPFEAFLLEALSDFQITVPELGAIKAAEPPIVILTSNRTRDIHDALKRRCLYHWLDYPDFQAELAILAAKAPLASAQLTREIASVIRILRKSDVLKPPGVAEAVDWAAALVALEAGALEPAIVADTLGAVLKHQEDLAPYDAAAIADLLQAARKELAGRG